jgi:CRISPR/Cas system CMR-associated protein Cmr5 small subunit
MTITRISDDMAVLAFEQVEAVTGDITKKCRARARDLPVLLHRTGLMATATFLDAKSSDPDWLFLRTSLATALGQSADTPLGRQLANAQISLPDQRELMVRAQAFAWWLKRAAEATWTS